VPDVQELIALGIVALVAGRLLWRRLGPSARRRRTAGACDGCGPVNPPRKEATIRFYRRRNDEGPASGAPGEQQD